MDTSVMDVPFTYDQVCGSLARSSHLEFMQYMWSRKDKPFLIGRHTIEICNIIDKAMEDYRAGKSTYLALKVCYRHGKSTIASINLPANFLGHFPGDDVMLVGYGAGLARGFSRDARKIMRDAKYQYVHPGVILSEESQSIDEWGIAGMHGKFQCMGYGGSVTGKGANLLVIDDFFSGREEAESEVMREKVWQSITNDCLTRLSPVHIVIILATPWHVDDPFGRIRKKMDEDPDFPRFREVRFPAISEGYGGDGTLFPERFSKSYYISMKAALGPYASAGLLQCDPVIRSGNLLRTDKIQVVADVPSDVRYVRGWDLASSKKERIKDNPDYTVGVKLGVRWLGSGVEGVRMPVLFIDDVVRGRWAAPARDEIIRQTSMADGAITVGVEAFGAYKDAYETLTKALYGLRTVKKIQLPGDKVTKAGVLEPVFEAGNVYMRKASWNEVMLKELQEFPGGEHDDLCFIGETMVATPMGGVEIRKLRVGDFVLTPFGKRKVVANSVRVVENVINFNGLIGTPDHLIYSDGKFVKMDTLTVAFSLSILEIREVVLWRYLKLCGIMEKSFEGWEGKESIISLRQQQTVEGSILKDFMLRFGNFIIKRKFRKACSFITKTGILLITTLTTLSVFHLANTLKHFVRWIKKNSWRIWKKFVPLRRGGILRKQERNGIERMGKDVGSDGNEQNGFVLCVENLFGRHFQEQDSVLICADKDGGLEIEKKLNRSAFPVEKNLWQNKDIQGQEKPVPESARLHCVYNLQIEKDHVYYANGILVGNCDALVVAFTTHNPFVTMVWESAELKARNFRIKWDAISEESTLLVSEWVGHDMATSLVMGLWNARMGKLWIWAEREYSSPRPEKVMVEVGSTIKRLSGGLKGFKDFEWVGSESMFSKDGGDLEDAYRKYGVSVIGTGKYDELGAIQLVSRLWQRKAISIGWECQELLRQISDWHIDGGRAAAGYGLCRALCNMVRTIYETGKAEPMEEAMKPYSKEKTAFLKAAHKASLDGSWDRLSDEEFKALGEAPERVERFEWM